MESVKELRALSLALSEINPVTAVAAGRGTRLNYLAAWGALSVAGVKLREDDGSGRTEKTHAGHASLCQ